MYLNQPVMIPKAPGKITIKKKGDARYIQYETGRAYDPNRKYNIPERQIIGVEIPGRPDMMLPNENYLALFPKEEENMTKEEKQITEAYANERDYGLMLRDFFDQLFFEFQTQSRRKPNSVVNEYKTERLNRVLRPLKEMMKGEAYAAFLEEIPKPEEKEEDGKKTLHGLTYSDVALMLTQFKGAVNRFFHKR